MDYSFTVSTESMTGFILQASSSTSIYTKLILNYISAGDSSNMKTYSVIPNSTYGTSAVFLDTKYQWDYTVSGITDSLQQLAFFHFVPVLSVIFLGTLVVGVNT